MSLSKILGFIAKRWTYVVMLLALAVYGYIEHSSPRQPDPASGHVLRVIAPKHRRSPRHVMYLTGTERSLYYGSFIVMAVGTLGLMGHALLRNRNRATTTS
jgi:hypothetical protein